MYKFKRRAQWELERSNHHHNNYAANGVLVFLENKLLTHVLIKVLLLRTSHQAKAIVDAQILFRKGNFSS